MKKIVLILLSIILLAGCNLPKYRKECKKIVDIQTICAGVSGCIYTIKLEDNSVLIETSNNGISDGKHCERIKIN